MQRQRGGLGGPVKVLRDASPQAVHHYTRFDQVNALVSASEARVLTRFVLKYTLRAAHLELGGVEREVRRSGKP